MREVERQREGWTSPAEIDLLNRSLDCINMNPPRATPFLPQCHANLASAQAAWDKAIEATTRLARIGVAGVGLRDLLASTPTGGLASTMEGGVQLDIGGFGGDGGGASPVPGSGGTAGGAGSGASSGGGSSGGTGMSAAGGNSKACSMGMLSWSC